MIEELVLEHEHHDVLDRCQLSLVGDLRFLHVDAARCETARLAVECHGRGVVAVGTAEQW
jgi:hypothetical protein